MRNKLRYLALLGCLLLSGCNLLPDIAHQPTLHNPFPQLSKVAVTPFFNLDQRANPGRPACGPGLFQRVATRARL